MKTKKHDTSWMVSVALMAAIVIVLANTPLGMIQLPIIKATTVHIPVILGAILLGPAAGAILGGVFGICSLISNTMAPTLLSFAFSPFMSTTGIPGAIKAVWISVGCRILIGVAAGWLWILFSKLKVNSIIALPIVGFAGAMVNTITVMGSIYILFAKFLFFRIYRTSHWQLLSYKYIAKEDLPALFLEPEGLLSSIHLLSQHFQYSFFEIHQVILFRLPEPKLLLQSPLEFRML